MGPTLIIVERSHRGAVEQQYAHVLWLVRTLRRQAPVALLLRGPAAVYALDAEAPPAPRIADRIWGVAADYREALLRLAEDGAEVLVAASSLDQLGLRGRPLVPGVYPVSEADIVARWTAYERIWFL